MDVCLSQQRNKRGLAPGVGAGEMKMNDSEPDTGTIKITQFNRMFNCVARHHQKILHLWCWLYSGGGWVIVALNFNLFRGTIDCEKLGI